MSNYFYDSGNSIPNQQYGYPGSFVPDNPPTDYSHNYVPDFTPPSVQESGGIVSATALGGSRATTYAKSGGVVSAMTLGSPKAASAVKGGGLLSAASLSGIQARLMSRAGGIVSISSLGGLRQLTITKTAGVLSSSTLSGSRLIVFSKLSGTQTAAQLGGMGLTAVVRSGGITVSASFGGLRLTTINKVGGSFSTYTIGGVGTRIVIGSSLVSGGISAGLTLGGTAVVLVFQPTPPFIPPYPPRPRHRHRPQPKRKQRKKVSRTQIEQHAETLIARKQLPQYLSKGAQKAYTNMQVFYGTTEGRRIFIKKAIEQGRRVTLVDKINDVYATGATVDTKQKLRTRVSVPANGQPQVKILGRKG